MQTYVKSTGSFVTEDIAEKLGRKLHGGEIIELVSDLGGGKTTFVRGLARGLGSNDKVRSPSFTIANLYRAGELTLHHFDFYRLDDPGIVARELAEITTDTKAIVVIEWAMVIGQALPRAHLVVSLNQTGEQTRDITLDYPEQYAYLFDKQA
jgi:tRNA threonylcarbamoyladenosine biosynthesis protein TsaE